ncbi:3-deoxy-8-phosphooctulonate synthase [bacterium]|nr:3-deoxy-8-phosphooctulonate synthase [bacterium]
MIMIEVKKIKLRNFEIGGDKLTILAGPCAIESYECMAEVAGALKEICKKLDINYIFKASYDKANRSTIDGYRGLGIDKGLEYLAKIKKEFDVPIVTDVHNPQDADKVAEVADIIQIPAFLCRQTDLLVAAAKTGKIINIKKGQFLAPQQMQALAQKVTDSGNNNILFTERGVSFGYNNLVTDMRAIPLMQMIGYPVVMDATHSVQMPGTNGCATGGDRRWVPVLAKSAIAAGVNALFFEVHPEPEKGLCDADNMLPLKDAENLFKICNDIFRLVREEY